jgi:predicted metal-dependent phosphoesterase TrpH
MTKEKYIDLHIHTICSDGAWTPQELIECALQKNLAAIAITDHDSIDAIEQAKQIAFDKDIEIIAGVELSTYSEGEEKEIHMLGYFIDYTAKEFVKELDFFRNARLNRAYEMVDRFKRIGIEFADLSFLKDAGRKSIGRLHFAKALKSEGFVSTIQEAFQKYIGNNCPAYVAKVMPTSRQAIELILKFGGIPVIAHPYYLSNREIIKELAGCGLMGLEVWHIKHSKNVSEDFLQLSKQLNLIATGGSDCHGDCNATIGKMKVPYKVLENLKKALPVFKD